MTSNIPAAGGVPGISGPPDWLGVSPDYSLDDVRWRGATQRTFGGGASQSAVFKAIQVNTPAAGGAVDGAIYLSFRAAYVQALSAANDYVYFGIRAGSGGKAMVARIQVHGASFTPAGPPSANPPANIASLSFWTSTNNGASWTLITPNPGDPQPTWINTSGRSWLHPADGGDPNNRWAVQLKIPVTSAMVDIIDAGGPNLGANFTMWYLIRATVEVAPGNYAPVILGEYRTTGTTNVGNLNGTFPATSAWEQYALTSGPGAFGGIAITWGDVLVQNGLGTGTTIQNGANNTFIARPRNYRPAIVNAGDPDFTIPVGDIEATFRIANWGSVSGQPWNPNFATGQWDMVPGVQPVPSQDPIPVLTAGSNPPATNPIRHTTLMNLAAGKSTHQCVLVTLTGNSLNFLNDSLYQNMNYDHASTLAREAEISVKGLTPFSAQPRDVYLAVEKVNMQVFTPGRDEGQFLNATLAALIDRGGPLGAKLRTARAILLDSDGGSGEALQRIMDSLRAALQQMKYNDPAQGAQRVEQLTAALERWLNAVKISDGQPDPAAIERLAALFDALADWLQASGLDQVSKLNAFIATLNRWLQALPNDPFADAAAAALEALLAWLESTVGGDQLTGPIAVIRRWFDAGQPAEGLPGVIAAFAEFLTAIASGANRSLTVVAANFGRAAAGWLRGEERLDTMVDVLSSVGLTDDELDQVFPTLRIHPYYDTGERITDENGRQQPVLAAQSSFGIYAYHEGTLDGWQTALSGATRIADNLYLLSVPNNGSAKVTVKVQAVEPGEARMPEDPIKPRGNDNDNCGCLCQILKMLGLKK